MCHVKWILKAHKRKQNIIPVLFPKLQFYNGVFNRAWLKINSYCLIQLKRTRFFHNLFTRYWLQSSGAFPFNCYFISIIKNALFFTSNGYKRPCLTRSKILAALILHVLRSSQDATCYNFTANKYDNVIANKSRLSTCRVWFACRCCSYWDACHANRRSLCGDP